jgi:hypothetical protein
VDDYGANNADKVRAAKQQERLQEAQAKEQLVSE